MLDYLIIGSGLAGISFAEIAIHNQKSILVIDNNSQNSSKIAAGIYNPVILKRLSEVSDAKEHLQIMNRFLENVEKKLKCKINHQLPLVRKFFSIEEQNNWFAASDKVNLSTFLSTDLIFKKYQFIDSPFGYGEVQHTGFVDTALLLKEYRNYLIGNNQFIEEKFDHSLIKQQSNTITYKNIVARHIVFAEGFGLHSNPYFLDLPLDGTKGELLIIKAPLLDLDVIINTSLFIVPLGDGIFKIGATYNWEDKTALPTEQGKHELIEKIRKIILCDFEIIQHLAGVRPTVKDRKPLIGTHVRHNSIHIINGLGTRGVMLGPAMAADLFAHIEYLKPLNKTIDIKRFAKKN